MKAYLFNSENGLYEGETFEEAGMLQHEGGVTRIPPPNYEHGQVPVFDLMNNAWNVMPISVARQLLCLNSGRVARHPSSTITND